MRATVYDSQQLRYCFGAFVCVGRQACCSLDPQMWTFELEQALSNQPNSDVPNQQKNETKTLQNCRIWFIFGNVEISKLWCFHRILFTEFQTKNINYCVKNKQTAGAVFLVSEYGNIWEPN